MRTEGSGLLTTGQAAKLCSVTQDTILKWIKKGRLSGVRTAGGHYRIERRDVEPFIPSAQRTGRPSEQVLGRVARALRCWEFLKDQGTIRDECLQCVVYKVGAERCFLMTELEGDLGHSRQFCESSCEPCVYYRWVQGLPANVLVITSDDDLVERLSVENHESVVLRFARTAYEASAVIHDFRPVLVAIDVEQVSAIDTELLDSLTVDPRIPGLRIVLLVPAGMTSRRRRQLQIEGVVGVLEKPLGAREVAAVVGGLPVNPLVPSYGGSWAASDKE